jgi:hypothetical protein
MNTLPLNEVMKYKHRITDLLIPLNKLIQEAYEAGVEDINVLIERERFISEKTPMIAIFCHKIGS